MYACLAVTCHLHFWQNDRDFLRATVVTRGWNGYRNKSQHRKSTLEKKIFPPFQQGFEPATFQSRVRRSNHWAIPAPLSRLSEFTLYSVSSCAVPVGSQPSSVWLEGGSNPTVWMTCPCPGPLFFVPVVVCCCGSCLFTLSLSSKWHHELFGGSGETNTCSKWLNCAEKYLFQGDDRNCIWWQTPVPSD